ncbi:unnamed protein product [Closterium sp. NIES-53]
MASLRVLAFDHEGRPLHFDTWLDNQHLYLLSDSRDSVSLFDQTSGAAPAPPTTADSATRSQWLTRDAAARLAIRNHLLLAECSHFGQHRTAQTQYDAVVARYSSLATAALGCLLLPYLFPELSAFATVEDLVSHLRTSDARYRAAAPAEDHFISLDPTSLTVDLLEQHLLAAIGAARGTPRTPFIEGCSPSPLAPSFASAAVVDVLSSEDVGAAFASAKRRSSKGKGGRGGGGGSRGGGGGSSGGNGGSGGGGSGGSGGGSGGAGGGGGGSGGSGGSGSGGSGGGRTGAQRGGTGGGQRQRQQCRSESSSAQQLREWLFQHGASGGSVSCPYVIRTGDRACQTCGKLHTQHRCFSCLDDAWRAEFGDEVEGPHWAELLRSGVAIFDLDYDAILSAMYALSASAEGDCYQCVPPEPGIEAAALGASESSLLGTAPAEALHIFTLTQVPHAVSFVTEPPSLLSLQLSRSYWLTLSGARSLPVPPLSFRVRRFRPVHCQVFTSPRSLRTWVESIHTRYRASSGSCVCSGVRVRSGSRLLLVSPPVTPDSSQAPPPGSPLPATPSWHALPPPCIWSSQVSASPPALPALPSLRCVEGQQHAAPHSSSFPPMTAPLQTLHMDVWSPAGVSGQGRERYILLVLDDYTQYTTVFPLRSKGQVVDVLIPWIRAVRQQLREGFHQDLPVLGRHSDKGGEFSSDLLRDFCRGEGILQSFTLLDSSKQNGFAECRIGLVMEVARTSMLHPASPHFLWPFAVRYAAHQLNLWPRVSLPETCVVPKHYSGTVIALPFRLQACSASGTFWGGSKGVHGAMGEGMGSEEGDGGAGGHGGMFYCVPEACSEDMVVPASKVALHRSSHWVIDTGAFMTMTNREDLLDEVRPSKAATIVSATGQVVPVRGEGRAMFMGADGRLVGLKRVLLVPGLCANLLSTKALSEARMKMEMMGTKVFKATLDGRLLWDLQGGKDMHRSMWEIPVLPWKEVPVCLAAEALSGGHASHVTSGGGGDGSDGGLLVHGGGALPSLQQLFKEERVKGLRIKGEPKEMGSCETCLTSKFSRFPFHSTVGQSSDPVELVHVDLVEPMKVKGDGGALYSMTMVDDYTRLTWSFPLAKKSDAARVIIEEWVPMLERESGKWVKAIRSDRGGEFFGVDFRSWLKRHGIKQQLTTTYTPQSNGVAERANRTIIEGGRTILVDSGLPLRFWPLAIRHATVIKNRVLTHVGGQHWVPMEKWSGKKPLVDMLHVFGCMGLVHVPKEKRDKQEALAGDDREAWLASREDEFPSQMENETWILTNLPPEKKALDCTWVLRVKTDVEGRLESRKTRLVIKGFQQREGIDFQEVFSPVAKAPTLRLLLEAAAVCGWKVEQMDVKMAFLYGVVDEEIYMKQPEGYDDGSGRVCRLNKAIYGLKQAPRCWYARLVEALEAFGFKVSTCDESLFMTEGEEEKVFLIVYVDDILLFSPSLERIKEVQGKLKETF